MNRHIGLVLAAAICCSHFSSAHAQFTVFTDRVAFTAALTSSTTETYDVPQAFVLGNNLYNDVNYQITGSSIGGNGINGGLYNGDEFTTSSLNLIFPASINGFGADFTAANTAAGLTFTILGQTFVLGDSLPNPGTGFFGIISTVPFTSVDVGSGPPPNEIYTMDNMTFGTVAVPEPATWALLGVGAVCLSGGVGYQRWKLRARRFAKKS